MSKRTCNLFLVGGLRLPVAGDMARDTPTGKEDKTGAAHGTGGRRRGTGGKRECSGVFGGSREPDAGQGETIVNDSFTWRAESRTRGICDILSSDERVAFVRLNPCAVSSAFALRGKTLTIPNTGATIGSGTAHGRRTACACRSSGGRTGREVHAP